jgi:hypothetical protein
MTVKKDGDAHHFVIASRRRSNLAAKKASNDGTGGLAFVVKSC